MPSLLNARHSCFSSSTRNHCEKRRRLRISPAMICWISFDGVKFKIRRKMHYNWSKSAAAASSLGTPKMPFTSGMPVESYTSSLSCTKSMML